MQSENEKAFWRDQPEMIALRQLTRQIDDAWSASVDLYSVTRQRHPERADLLIPTNTLLYYAKIDVRRVMEELEAIQQNRHKVMLANDQRQIEQL